MFFFTGEFQMFLVLASSGNMSSRSGFLGGANTESGEISELFLHTTKIYLITFMTSISSRSRSKNQDVTYLIALFKFVCCAHFGTGLLGLSGFSSVIELSLPSS